MPITSQVRLLLAIVSYASCTLLATGQVAADDSSYFMHGGDAYSASQWNEEQHERAWTHDGKSFHAAETGKTYSTNGYRVRAGESSYDQPNSFAGDLLLIEGPRDIEGIAGGDGPGELLFEADSSESSDQYWLYRADLKAVTPSARIVASQGRARLDGTLQIDDLLQFRNVSSTDSMHFVVGSRVTGRGNITITGSASGGSEAGDRAWSFEDLSDWRGGEIAVMADNTLRVSTDLDLAAMNPRASVRLKNGYIELDADLHVASGKFLVTDAQGELISLEDGAYDARSINDLGMGDNIALGEGTLTVGPAR